MPAPFALCVPAPSTGHATWIIDALRGRDGVAFVVPAGFERYARVHHDLPDVGRWREVAPQYLVPGTERYPYPFPDDVTSAEGDAGAAVVDRLAGHLVDHGGDGPAHYGLWTGWGDLHAHSIAVLRAPPRWPWSRGSRSREASPEERAWRERARVAYDFVDACPVLGWWGGRDMWLFDGPASAVRTVGAASSWGPGAVDRRSTQWWWPPDRRWFVANEIDHPWSYVAGPADLVERVLADPTLEAVPVAPDDQW